MKGLIRLQITVFTLGLLGGMLLFGGEYLPGAILVSSAGIVDALIYKKEG
jgi:hypothetical protein